MKERIYHLDTSEEVLDPEWDAFLETTPGGDHLQSSAWGCVKSSIGWRPVRLLARRNGHIVGGAQILIRDAPVVGPIGCIAKGPVFATEDPALMKLLLDELKTMSDSLSLRKLCLQPSMHYCGFDDLLQAETFRPSTFKLMPPATTRLDLSLTLDELLANMKSRTRYNVRRSERQGIVVRPGTSKDLHTYYRLVQETSNRKDFAHFPRHYYDEIWRVLHENGQMHLLVAEVGGETVSALMLIVFGDTAVNKLGVWSGQHGDKRPNDAIHWAAVKLAKSLGLRYYDLGGISKPAARAILNGDPLPESAKQTVTSFKLDFGGEVILYPDASEFHRNTLYRWAFGEVYPRLHRRKTVKRVFNWMRTRDATFEG